MSKLGVDLTRQRGKRRMQDIAKEIGLSASTVCRAEMGLKVSPASSRLIRVWLSAEDARQCKTTPTYVSWNDYVSMTSACRVQASQIRVDEPSEKPKTEPRSDTAMIIASYWITAVNVLAAVLVISIVLSRTG